MRTYQLINTNTGEPAQGVNGYETEVSGTDLQEEIEETNLMFSREGWALEYVEVIHSEEVKQRNLFSDAIDILSDDKSEATEVQCTPSKVIIEAFNNGMNVRGIAKSRQKGFSDLPLFKVEQTTLF